MEQLDLSNCETGGLYAGVASRDRDCRFHDNPGYGVYASQGSVLSGCTAQKCATGGILTFVGCTIHHCAALQNGRVGIDAGSGSTVSGCVALYNQGLSGIYGRSGTTIVGCTAYGNDGTNTHFDSYGIPTDDHWIDSNTVTDNDTGIAVDEPGNLIIRNSAACSFEKLGRLPN